MAVLSLPPDVEAVIREFFTCEMTTIGRDGRPVTWPVLPYFDREEGRIITTASIAFAVKAANAQRTPQVSLLYSDPTGSGLTDPPAVLVQGDASVVEIEDSSPWSLELFKTGIRRQPASRKFIAVPLVRRLFTFNYQRIAIMVRPRRLLVWPHGAFQAAPVTIEVPDVE